MLAGRRMLSHMSAFRSTAGRALRREELLALGTLGTLGTLGALAGLAGCAPAWPGAGAPRDATSGPPPVAAAGGDFERPQEVTSGGARLRYDPAQVAWTVGNRRFEERLELRPAPGGGFSLPAATCARRRAASGPAWPRPRTSPKRWPPRTRWGSG